MLKDSNTAFSKTIILSYSKMIIIQEKEYKNYEINLFNVELLLFTRLWENWTHKNICNALYLYLKISNNLIICKNIRNALGIYCNV